MRVHLVVTQDVNNNAVRASIVLLLCACGGRPGSGAVLLLVYWCCYPVEEEKKRAHANMFKVISAYCCRTLAPQTAATTLLVQHLIAFSLPRRFPLLDSVADRRRARESPGGGDSRV